MDPLVYRIVTLEEWQEMKDCGLLPLNPVDERDGFIHLSLECQVKETANRYFAMLREVVVLAFPTGALGAQLMMEIVEERHRTVFPHFYGERLTLAQVHQVFRLRNSSDGFGALEPMESLRTPNQT